ncbi:ERBB receptor feedback inhibitor 1a isoform X2 [Misgurnus anguillicaudatus]|uniref:ERBB receptor feedback inhibitor 1a isoform X2 n=1 Tax=Misgurnus anguillicaudatus TaxID=75329 RepID=UPI003CCFD41A
MRIDCSCSMSTAGLTAQEICLPAQSLFLRASHWHSMAGKYLHNLYFTLDSSKDYNLQSQQQVPSFSERARLKSPNSPVVQPVLPKKSRPTQLTLSTSSPVEDDQVVPCFQRLTVSDRNSPPQTPSRVAKPLPPIPGSAELSPDHATDSEVEFFNGDDNSCLVSETCSKHSPFRYGMLSRRSLRDCGQINYAYYEGPIPQQKQQLQVHPKPQVHPQVHTQVHPQVHTQVHPQVHTQVHPQVHTQVHPQVHTQVHPQVHTQVHPQVHTQVHPQKLRQERETQQREHHNPQQQNCLRQQERTQKKLRRSNSGPPGCLNKHHPLRLATHHRHTQVLDKPEVPPRVPIPPRPVKDYRRWSAEVPSGAHSDEDRPPKVPPREPLSGGNSRTPSPKSLPVYLNGIMPPTQSFAPNPQYVSLQRQNSEGSPCILPVIENGRIASTTHYFLLPQRPAYLDKHEKYLTDISAGRGADVSDSSSDWDCQSKRKTTHQIDLV